MPQTHCLGPAAGPQGPSERLATSAASAFERKPLQRQVAKQIGLGVPTNVNLERNRAQPEPRHMPAIISFLGYNPLPGAGTPAKRLVRERTALGFSQRDYAAKLGVPMWKLALWERGEQQAPRDFVGAPESRMANEA